MAQAQPQAHQSCEYWLPLFHWLPWRHWPPLPCEYCPCLGLPLPLPIPLCLQLHGLNGLHQNLYQYQYPRKTRETQCLEEYRQESRAESHSH